MSLESRTHRQLELCTGLCEMLGSPDDVHAFEYSLNSSLTRVRIDFFFSRLLALGLALLIVFYPLKFWQNGAIFGSDDPLSVFNQSDPLSVFIVVYTGVLLYSAIAVIAMRHLYGRGARARLVKSIWNTLLRLEKERDDFSPIWWERMKTLRHLERTSRIIERSSSAFRTGDPQNDRYVRDENRKIAMHFRSRKIWILQPGPLTRKDLIHEYNRILIDAVVGDWHKLPRATAVQPAVRTRSQEFLIALVQLSPIFLAIGVLLAIRSTGIAIDFYLILLILIPSVVISANVPGGESGATLLARVFDIAGKLGPK